MRRWQRGQVYIAGFAWQMTQREDCRDVEDVELSAFGMSSEIPVETSAIVGEKGLSLEPLAECGGQDSMGVYRRAEFRDATL